MIIQLKLDVTEAEIQWFIVEAYKMGWSREEPQKTWTEKEQKEAVRYAAGQILARSVPS